MVTVCGRAVGLISVEDWVFFLRAGAMACINIGTDWEESVASLANVESNVERKSKLEFV